MKNTIILAATALMLGACSKENTPQSNPLPEDSIIRISTSVENIATRAGYADNSSLDSVFLTITNADFSSYSYSNVYMKKETPGWVSYTDATVTTPLIMRWKNSTSPVTVRAISHNLSDDLNSVQVEADQSIAKNARLSDLLYATASNIAPAATPDTDKPIYYDAALKALRIKMGHAMSKLRVNIRYGSEMTQGGVTPVISSVKLTGTKLSGAIALATGAITPTTEETSRGAITFMAEQTPTTDFAATYEGIVLPQNSEFGIVITIDSKEFLYTSAAKEFAAGQCNSLNLTVGRDAITLNGFTASDWDNNTTGGELVTE